MSISRAKGLKLWRCFRHYSITHKSWVLLEKLTVAVTSQVISRILWNPKVYYRVHMRPPLSPILSQINPFHSITLYICKIHSKREFTQFLTKLQDFRFPPRSSWELSSSGFFNPEDGTDSLSRNFRNRLPLLDA